jgi:hypothetical protein
MSAGDGPLWFLDHAIVTVSPPGDGNPGRVAVDGANATCSIEPDAGSGFLLRDRTPARS